MKSPEPNAKASAIEVLPASFDAERHWYPKVLNATIHPMVHFFLHLDQVRIINRYCHLHPIVNANKLKELLDYKCRYFLWAGADLFNVTSASGRRQMVIVENNSCPSGQKSMPWPEDNLEQGAYKWLIERTFAPFAKEKNLQKGRLAVIYDKNLMETSGYASVIADVFKEPVFLAPFYENDLDPPVRFVDGIMEVRDNNMDWQPIRAAFRYVTQRPWTRIPSGTKTKILNPIIACLAGGRNKMVAAKAYTKMNEDLSNFGLKINTPETIWDVKKQDIPYWVASMGGQAVVKVPYSNAGQGVFTIVNQLELEKFMKQDFAYNRFIVQSLIGNYRWSSTGATGKLYHVGTVPNSAGKTFAADLRMMVSSTETGIRPLCLYTRRARKPLEAEISDGSQSWDVLGTNLSIKNPDGTWGSDTNRLLVMDRRDFNKLGLGIDDLIEAFIQTVLSMIAIDQMAAELVNNKGKLKLNAFKLINDDPALLEEILH